MSESGVVNAIDRLAQEVQGSQIASQQTVDSPAGVVATTDSAEIIAGNGARLVLISNLDQTKEVFFAVAMDAVPDAGIVLFPGQSSIIPLGEGRGLNAITQVGSAKLSWQSFG